MVELETRTLIENGMSVISSEEAARRIFHSGTIPDHFSVDASDQELENYKQKYRIDLSIHDDDLIPPKPRRIPSREEIDELFADLSNSSRLSSDSKYQFRLDEELEWFESSKNLHVLVHVNKMLKRFREDGIVWGVGRGSSCASLVFYVLGAHDIDPVKFNIPFYEMSKEM